MSLWHCANSSAIDRMAFCRSRQSMHHALHRPSRLEYATDRLRLRPLLHVLAFAEKAEIDLSKMSRLADLLKGKPCFTTFWLISILLSGNSSMLSLAVKCHWPLAATACSRIPSTLKQQLQGRVRQAALQRKYTPAAMLPLPRAACPPAAERDRVENTKPRCNLSSERLTAPDLLCRCR